ncbi:hypothetical protein [Companilactobacillus muriivasis]|uniref:hypothetical protein n=1 Tax=Companilactobacillus muriivasis TaxID=3081444 RepID=UPI0030C706EE
MIIGGLIIISGIIGGLLGLLGVVISIVFSKITNRQNLNFQRELETSRKKYNLWVKKYDVLVQLISYRHNLRSEEFTSALNGVVAVYFDSILVKKRVDDFFEYITLPSRDENVTNDKLVDIFIEMYKDLGIADNIDSTDLKRVFNLRDDAH